MKSTICASIFVVAACADYDYSRTNSEYLTTPLDIEASKSYDITDYPFEMVDRRGRPISPDIINYLSQNPQTEASKSYDITDYPFEMVDRRGRPIPGDIYYPTTIPTQMNAYELESDGEQPPCNRNTRIIEYDPKTGTYFHPCDRHLYINDDEDQQIESFTIGKRRNTSILDKFRERARVLEQKITRPFSRLTSKLLPYSLEDNASYLDEAIEEYELEDEEIDEETYEMLDSEDQSEPKPCNRNTRIIEYDPKTGTYFHPCDRHLYVDEGNEENIEAFEILPLINTRKSEKLCRIAKFMKTKKDNTKKLLRRFRNLNQTPTPGNTIKKVKKALRKVRKDMSSRKLNLPKYKKIFSKFSKRKNKNKNIIIPE